MTHNRHSVDTLSLHFLATAPIELTVGGGLGCPDGASANNDLSGLV